MLVRETVLSVEDRSHIKISIAGNPTEEDGLVNHELDSWYFLTVHLSLSPLAHAVHSVELALRRHRVFSRSFVAHSPDRAHFAAALGTRHWAQL